MAAQPPASTPAPLADWALDQELGTLIERAHNTMDVCTAARLFDQAMEQSRHWDWEYSQGVGEEDGDPRVRFGGF